MELVTDSNFMKVSFKNLVEILETNSNGYKVTSSFSNNSNIPIIVVTNRFDPNTQYSDGSQIFTLTATIDCIGKTTQASQELAQEVYNLLTTNDGSFNQYGMSLNQKLISTPSPIFKGENRLLVTTVAVQMDLI